MRLGLVAALGVCCALFATQTFAQEQDKDSAAKKEVMATLEAMASASIKGDVAALSKLYRDDVIYNHSNGMTWNKEQVMKAYAAGMPQWLSMRFSDPIIQIYGNVAVVKLTADFDTKSAGTVSSNHHTQLWVLVKGPQGWQIVVRQTVVDTSKH